MGRGKQTSDDEAETNTIDRARRFDLILYGTTCDDDTIANDTFTRYNTTVLQFTLDYLCSGFSDVIEYSRSGVLNRDRLPLEFTASNTG